jgi:tetratricopeptide (TPR) repeat protein
MGRTENPLQLTMEMGTKKKSKHDFELYQFSAHTIQLQLSYHFGNIEMALSIAKAARNSLDSFDAICYCTFLFLYDGMTALEAAHGCQGLRRRKYLSVARGRLKKLKTLAKTCPENILHKAHLLRGEFYACSGKLGKAAESFRLAIDNASERGMWQFLALAHERAAVAFHRLGNTPEHRQKASENLNQAIDAYTEWGAIAIVSYLKESKKDIVGLAAKHGR